MTYLNPGWREAKTGLKATPSLLKLPTFLLLQPSRSPRCNFTILKIYSFKKVNNKHGPFEA